MTTATPSPDSRLLQILLDAEKPIRVSCGDGRYMAVHALHALGLVDYRKSGWWATSEAGRRLVGGSVCVEGFLASLASLARRVAQQNGLLARPRGLSGKARRQRDDALRAGCDVLRWVNTGRA